MHRNSKHSFLVLFAGMALGWMATVVTEPADLKADDRRAKPPLTFKSGGERSVVILEKISGQIEKLDKRLALIEASIVGTKKN